MTSSKTSERFLVLIPAYREEGRIGRVVAAIAPHAPVLVVDDGSPDGTAEEARRAGAVVIRHTVNQGKGAALQTGLRHAAEQGVDFVVTMDGDGQHDPADLPGFLRARQDEHADVIVGSRMGDPRGMPFVRRMTNRFMSWLLSREMGQRVPDTQSGYRLYARSTWPHLRTEQSGFAAESAVLLNLAAQGLTIGSVPIRVIYGDEKSKIRPGRDTVRFFRMLRDHRRQVRDGARGLPSESTRE
ncbi:MAG: glycosyltransferase family 2 protein [Lentisphaerae bacterium]|nr:glycosyltransferase family 2 protein [Lentisphaerota bacterium]